MPGEVRALGAVIMGVTTILVVAFAVLLVAKYLAPIIQTVEAIGR